jgi:Tfp pilus assembly protein PilV
MGISELMNFKNLNQQCRQPRRRKAGFTFPEVFLAMVVLTAILMLVGAMVPLMVRSVRYASDFNQAQSLTMHKVAQLQEAGYENIEGVRLNQSVLKIIDGTGTAPQSNANGDKSATLEFTVTDNVWRYFPGGATTTGTQNTTSATRPRGYIFISPYTPSAVTSGGVTRYNLIQATVVVQWWGWGSRNQMHNYSTTALLSRTTVE